MLRKIIKYHIFLDTLVDYSHFERFASTGGSLQVKLWIIPLPKSWLGFISCSTVRNGGFYIYIKLFLHPIICVYTRKCAKIMLKNMCVAW